jgi:hypothetical protein
MINNICKHLRRLMGIFYSGFSWFRAWFRRDRCKVFWFISGVLVVVVLLGLIGVGVFLKEPADDVFVGVEVGYDNVDDFVRFVDEVEDYVNLIVIGSLDITTNETSMKVIGDYLFNKGLYFIPFMFFKEYLHKPDFFQFAKERWGDRFLGLYLSDEAGGRQIDEFQPRVVDVAENNSDAATKYNVRLETAFQLFFANFTHPGNVTTFTADYALYWFDYEAGWDVVFTEFGWNFSRQLHVALGRGASRAYNKEWGVIITWTYRNPPYIEDAEMLYEDLVLAYNNGAKYIIVFNFPTNVTEYGLLTREHLDSIRRFWDYTHRVPQPALVSEAAYVLPEDYGYGFRGPEDTIWGLWSPDNLSVVVWNDANSLLVTYVEKMDIIYSTEELNRGQRYEKLIFWNGTVIQR